MNQKDYKEIAGILSQFMNDTKHSAICRDLANYFEREADKHNIDLGITSQESLKINRTFNKQQFLKDCGLK